jgi:hypothetical protein
MRREAAMTIFGSKHMTRRVEWFRVGRQVYACPPYTLDELRRWVAEYGEIPDLSGMPFVKPRARPPSHLNLRLIEDLTPPKEKAERSTPPDHWSTEQAA